METIEPKINISGAYWHRSVGRQEIYQEMINLEKAFRYCDGHDEPGRWLRLKKELGDVYRRIMKYYKNQRYEITDF